MYLMFCLDSFATENQILEHPVHCVIAAVINLTNIRPSTFLSIFIIEQELVHPAVGLKITSPFTERDQGTK